MKTLKLIFLLFFTFSLSFAQEKTWEVVYKEADSLMQKRNFKESIPLYETALILAETGFGKTNEKYLMTRNGIGRCAIFIWDKEKATKFLNENITLCKDYGLKSAIYAQALHNTGTFYLPSEQGNQVDLAKKYLSEALAIRKDILGKKHPDYANSLNNLANLNWIIGNYNTALVLYKEALPIRKDVLGEKHPDYASLLSNLAVLHETMGNYVAALSLHKEALDIRKGVLGTKHPDYAQSLNNLAVVYYAISDYVAALSFYKEALVIQKETLGGNHPDYISSLNNLVNVYEKMGNYPNALPLYKEALVIRKDILGKNHPDYSTSLNNLANLYKNMGNYAIALPLYKEALVTLKNIFGEKHPDYALSLNNLANLYYTTGNYDAALPLCEQALAIRKELLGEEHTYYSLSLNNLALLNWQINQNELAFTQLTQIKDWAISQIILQFPILTEQQKEAFFYENVKQYFNEYNTFAIEMPKVNTKELYNTQLATKAILMQSAQKMKSHILNSGDSVLINMYETWIKQKDAIIKVNEISEEDRKKKGINLDSLLELNEKIENQLSKKSEAFISLTEKKAIDWKEIKKKLNKGEAAIEIIRVNKFGVQKVVIDTSDVAEAPNFPKYNFMGLTDTVCYVALIIKKSSKKPEIVLLKNGNDLEQKFAKYQKNMILYM